MSTIVVNPGDVIVVNDSIAVKMSKVTEILQPVVKGAETTGPDVSIVNSISYYLCCIVFICIAGFLIWKIIEILSEICNNRCQHKWELNNRKIKQKSDLTDKLLDFLKSQASSKKNDVKPNVMLAISDVCRFLEKSAETSEAEDLRKYLMNLCTTLIKQSKEFTESKHAETEKKDNSLKETNPDNYVKALCTLIELIDKEKWDQDELDKLRSSCGLKIHHTHSEKPEEQ